MLRRLLQSSREEMMEAMRQGYIIIV